MVFSFFKWSSEKEVDADNTEKLKKEDEKSKHTSTDEHTKDDTQNSDAHCLTAASVYNAAPVSPMGRDVGTTSTSPAALSTPPPPPSRSTTTTTTNFEDALYATCWQDASLVALVQRVLLEHSSSTANATITPPRVSDEFIRAGDVSAVSRRIKEERQQERRQATTSAATTGASHETRKSTSSYDHIASLIITSPRKVYRGLSTTLETLSNVLVGTGEEEGSAAAGGDYNDNDVWTQEGDHIEAKDSDIDKKEEEEVDPLLDGKERVVCVQLVKQCIECILDQLEHESCSESVLVVSQHSSRGAHAKPTSCWTGWCRTIESSESTTEAMSALLKQLPSSDLDFLARVLVELGHAEQAVAASDKNLSLLLLRKRNSPPLSDTQRQTCIASFQLEQAINETEYKIAKWTAAVDDCTSRARQYKSTGDKKAALLQLQKRKLYKEKIELAEGSLLNLHQAQLQLESSQTSVVLSALKTTASALKQMRVEMPNVDSIVDDLQDELERQQQVETNFSSLVIVPQLTRTDDDELLEELQHLCLQDDEREEEEEEAAVVVVETSQEDGEKNQQQVAAAAEEQPLLELPEVPSHTPSKNAASTALPSKVAEGS
jgi:hypothetical protein